KSSSSRRSQGRLRAPPESGWIRGSASRSRASSPAGLVSLTATIEAGATESPLRMYLFFASLILLSLPAGGRAQAGADDPPLDLEILIDEALRSHPALQAFDSDRQAASERAT